MNSGTARNWVLGSWLVMLGLISFKQISQRPGLPSPGAYLGSAVLYTLYFGLAGLAPTLAAVLAAGTVVGGTVSPYLKGRSTGVLDQAANYLSTISGAPAPANPPTSGARPAQPS